MRQTPNSRPRQAGGAIFTGILIIALIVAAYYGYRAYAFYRENAASVIDNVSKISANASKFASILNPYKVTKDPNEVARQLKESFGIAPPEGYVGAFGLNAEVLGQKEMQLVALIPKDARPSDIFEGGRNQIRFNPGVVHDIPCGAFQSEQSR